MRLISTFFGKGLTLLVCLLMAGALQAQDCAGAVNFNSDVADLNSDGTAPGYYLEGGGTLAFNMNEAELTNGALSQNITNNSLIAPGVAYTFTVELEVISGAADISLEYFGSGFSYIGGEYSGSATAADGVTTLTVSGTPTDQNYSIAKIRVQNTTGTVRIISECLTAIPPDNGDNSTCGNAFNFNADFSVNDDGNADEPDGYYTENGGSTTYSAGVVDLTNGALSQNITNNSNAGPNIDYTFEVTLEVLSGEADISLEYFGNGFSYIGGEYSGAVTPADGMTTVTVSGASTDPNTTILKLRIRNSTGTVRITSACLALTPDDSGDVDFGCADNLITNGSFEGDVAADYDGNTTTTTDAVSGSQAVAIPQSDYTEISQTVAVTGGNAYQLTVQAKATGSGGYALARMQFMNDQGDMVLQLNTDVLGTEYQAYGVSGTAPDEATSVRVLFFAGGGNGITVDDACLVDLGPGAIPPVSPEPTGNLIPDYGFEDAGSVFDNGLGCFNANCGMLIRKSNDPASGMMAVTISGNSAVFFDVSNAAARGAAPGDVVPGAIYEGSIDAKVFGTPSFAQFKVDFKDGSGTVIANGADGSPIMNNVVFLSGSDYTTYTFSVEAPPGAETATVFAQKGDGGTLVVDNMSFVNTTALPVTLTSFQGTAMDKYNKLSWVTATEENTEMFYVERSRNGINNWVEVATAEAFGNSDIERAYSINDDQPLGRGFYRVRSVDFDGAQQISNVISIERATAGELNVYPNPASDMVTVESKLDAAGTYQIIDGIGRVLRTGAVQEGFQQTTVNIADLPRGRYIIRVGGESRLLIK